MEKRGLSAVITSMIIILVSLVAIGIVWIVISQIINSSEEDLSINKFTVNIGIKKANIVSDDSVQVTLNRAPGEGNIVGIVLLISNGTDTEKYENNTIINELEEKTFYINTGMNASEITSISIAPEFGNGIGDVTDICKMINGTCVESSSSTSSTSSTSSSSSSSSGIPPPEEPCGDGSCTAGETCSSCLADCACTGSTPYCSSGTCVGCTLSSHCNDDNACTTDSCESGSCQNTPITCNLGYNCNPSSGCEPEINFISWWKLEGNTNDEFGINNGVNNGATYTSSCHSGNCLSFDGINDYVRVIDSNSLDITQAMTLSVWFKPSNVTGVHTILGKNAGNPWATNSYTIFQSSQWVYCYLDDASGRLLRADSGWLNKDQWTHIVCVFDGTSTLKLYLNGALANTNVTSAFGNIRTSSSDFALGQTQTNNLPQGILDEVRIYDKALSAQEVSDLYNS